jgi:outer membrane protein TolC
MGGRLYRHDVDAPARRRLSSPAPPRRPHEASSAAASPPAPAIAAHRPDAPDSAHPNPPDSADILSMRRSAAPLAVLSLLAAAAGAPAGAAATGGGALTLADALALAAAHHETPAIAAARLERAEGLRAQAIATLLPSLTLGGTYTRRPREVTREIGGEDVTIQTRDALGADAVVESTLVDLRALPLVRAANAGLEAQKLESRELERALAFDVAVGFYTVLSAEELAAAARQRVELARSTSADAGLRLEAGLAARNELTRTRLELASAELARTEADNAVRSARLALGFLVGRDLGDRPLEAPAPGSPAERDAAALVERAVAASAELAALALRAEEARRLARAPALGIVPRLDARGVYRVTNEGGISGNEDDWNLAAILTWELFDGGARRAQARILGAEATEAELDLARRRREVAVEVESALAELATAEAAFDQARVAQEVAGENAEEVRERFGQGLATGLELADSLVSRFAAATELARQGYARALARLELERALGDWPGGAPPPTAPSVAAPATAPAADDPSTEVH